MQSTSAVIKYDCLYTRDTKKAKIWHDGYLRHHHFNSKLLLLSSDQAELASAFHRPSAFLTARIEGHSGGGQPLPDSFRLTPDTTIELDDGWLAQVGDVVLESRTNLKEIFDQTQAAKKTASKGAKAWALSVDSQDRHLPFSPKSSSFPTASSSAKGKERGGGGGDEIFAAPTTSTSGYKGFGIPPPRSYTSSTTAPPHKSSSSRGSTSTSSTSTPRPKSSTSTSKSNTNTAYTHNSTPRPKPYERPSSSSSHPHPHPSPSIGGSPYTITTSAAVSSPFRPPSFNRPSPSSAAAASGRSKSAGGGVPPSALGRKSLLREWNGGES